MATWIEELVDAEAESAKHAAEADRLRAVNAELLAALRDIIDYNRGEARDKYGDANKAETWACVTRARAAIARAEGAT